MDLKEARIHSADQVKRHPWELARWEVAMKLIADYIPDFNNKNLTVLDLGCGDTFFVEKMAATFPQHQYYAVDIAFSDAQLAELSHAFADKPIDAYASLEEATSAGPIDHIDLVLLLDVIEHIEDDISFMKWLKKFPQITSDTRVIISVPAFQKLFSAHDVFLEHFRRYTRSSLTDHLDKSGYVTSRNGYFFSSLLVPRLLQVGKEKIMGGNAETEQGVGAWNGGKWATSLMVNILKTDFAIAHTLRKGSIVLPGLSTYAICHPSEHA